MNLQSISFVFDGTEGRMIGHMAKEMSRRICVDMPRRREVVTGGGREQKEMGGERGS